MKTFDEMFSHKITPDSEYLIHIDGDEMGMSRDIGKCSICDNTTQFYSVSFGARYCSIKCINSERENYYLAQKEDPR